MPGFGGSTAGASQSLKNNRSMMRERGAYFKNRNRNAHRYVIPKKHQNSLASKQDMKQSYDWKLWKVWIAVGFATILTTWYLLQFIDL